jgi:hypothetical protein
MKPLSTPERHQLAIARKTLTLSIAGAMILGGPTHAEARAIILRLTGTRAPVLPEHGDAERCSVFGCGRDALPGRSDCGRHYQLVE